MDIAAGTFGFKFKAGNVTYIYCICMYVCISVTTSVQREVLKQQIGTWPTSKQDLIFKYQKEFSAFVESIDFEALQQSAQ
jgi:hypothetical protein